jgi:hypothetical protein
LAAHEHFAPCFFSPSTLSCLFALSLLLCRQAG